MTHPALITDEEFTEFLALVRKGATDKTAANSVGYAPSTIKARFDAKPEWGELYEQARLERKDSLADELRTEVRDRAFDRDDPKSWNALDRMLTANVPEYAAKSSVEIAGGNPVEVRVDHTVESFRDTLEGLIRLGLVQPGARQIADAEVVEVLAPPS